MFTLTSELLLTLFASSWIFVLCQETQEVTVKAGEDATLPCRGHRGAEITFIAWKTDDGYLFLFRDNRSREDDQLPSFCGRVELKDPKMKDGDVSVILKNVTINDTGTYECWIKEGNLLNSEPELFSTIKLTVTAGDKKGNFGLTVGLPVFAVLLVAVVGTMLFKKCRGKTHHTGGETTHTGGETTHTGGETTHTGGETDALNPQPSG